MIRYITVDGTHGFGSDDWNLARRVLTTVPDCHEVCPNERYEWNTALDGVWGSNITWRVSGDSLFYYAVPPLAPEARVPSKELLIIAFSHGAQVALYAFAAGLKGRLLTINPPIRGDMSEVVERARPNIKRWVNVYGNWKDIWAVLGAMGDGHFGLRRKHPQADINTPAPGPHGDALRNPRYASSWRYWIEEVTK